MVVRCEIGFDQNPAGTYFDGQLVSGTVTLNADRALEVKGIKLKIQGLSLTHWRERRFGRRQTFFGREDYLDTSTYLLGSERTDRTTLSAGIHTYNIACQLPTGCPSSFEGTHGYVRYMVKVLVLRPWKSDLGFARGFTVLKTVDLNYESPAMRIPSSSETYKTYCCGPWTTEPVKLVLNVPQTGFVPGQNIPVSVLVINNSNIAVSDVGFELAMLVRYYSERPPRHSCIERIVISQAQGESVLRNCTRSIERQLHVPATPPSCMALCKLIQIAYQVEVVAKMKGMHDSQIVSMPIVVGNVPLRQVVHQQPTFSRSLQMNGAIDQSMNKSIGNDRVDEEGKPNDDRAEVSQMPLADSVIQGHDASPAILDPDMPPPSYMESIHMVRADINDDEQHDFGPCEFAPLYPVYDIPSPSAPPTETQNGFQQGGYDNQTFQS